MEGLKNVFGIFLAGILTVFLSSCGTSKIDNPLNYDVQSFSFQNQDGKAVTLESLKGQVWVADFIFTNCETICPPMTSHMAELQNKWKRKTCRPASSHSALIPKMIRLKN